MGSQSLSFCTILLIVITFLCRFSCIMSKIFTFLSLCLLLAVADAKFLNKDKHDKKNDKLKCTHVIDEVTHEVCRTEYQDECMDKVVDDCKTIWNKVCNPATEKKCRFVKEDKCIQIPYPYCVVNFEEKCRTDCVAKVRPSATLRTSATLSWKT